jgi:tetratricopeptide (TPR) repeat protein
MTQCQNHKCEVYAKAREVVGIPNFIAQLQEIERKPEAGRIDPCAESQRPQILALRRSCYPRHSSGRTGTVAVLILAALFSLSTAPPSAADDRRELQTLIASRQLDSAEKIIVAQLMDKPQDPELITLLAEVRLDQGRAAEALTLIRDAELLGGVTALRAQLTALADSAAGRLDLAEPQFRAAIRLDPNYAAAHYFLARLLYTRNRFDEAIQESKNAIALSPGLVRAYENLGLCYEGKHNLKEAERWYREAIRQDETSVNKTEWPALDLATMLIHEERLAEAKPYLRQALAINPANAKSLFEMGVLQEKSGDSQAALQEFREALKFDARLAEAYYHAARICQVLGRKDEAQQYFAKFKEVSGKKH